MSSHVSESPQYQMPQKRGIKTKKKEGMKEKRTSESHGEAKAHIDIAHADTLPLVHSY